VLMPRRLVDRVCNKPSAHHALIQSGDVASCRHVTGATRHRLAECKRERKAAIRRAALDEARKIAVSDIPGSAVQKHSTRGREVLKSVSRPDDGSRHQLPGDAQARTKVIFIRFLGYAAGVLGSPGHSNASFETFGQPVRGPYRSARLLLDQAPTPVGV